MRALRSILEGLTTREGCRLRSIRNRFNESEDYALTYARFLHSMLPAPGSQGQGDKVPLARPCTCTCPPCCWGSCTSTCASGLLLGLMELRVMYVGRGWRQAFREWREFRAPGSHELHPLPSMVSASEFESLLRFVPDPEDVALLLYWFPLKPRHVHTRTKREGTNSIIRPPEEEWGTTVAGRGGAGVEGSAGEVAVKSAGEQQASKLPSGGKSGHVQGQKSAGSAERATADSEDAQGAETPASLPQDAAGGSNNFGRTSSIAMFKARPVTPKKGAAPSVEDEQEDAEQTVVKTEREAVVLVAKAVKLTRMLAPEAGWGLSCKRRLRQPVDSLAAPGHRRSLFVHPEVSRSLCFSHCRSQNVAARRGVRSRARNASEGSLCSALPIAHRSLRVTGAHDASLTLLAFVVHRLLSWRVASSASGLSTKTPCQAPPAPGAACHSRRQPSMDLPRRARSDGLKSRLFLRLLHALKA